MVIEYTKTGIIMLLDEVKDMVWAVYKTFHHQPYHRHLFDLLFAGKSVYYFYTNADCIVFIGNLSFTVPEEMTRVAAFPI